MANSTESYQLYHRAVTQLYAEIALNLTESVVLPFDIQWYATHLKEEMGKIKMRYGHQLKANNETTHFSI